MKKLFFALVFLSLGGIAIAQEEPPRHYRADLVTMVGKNKSVSKIYIADTKTRTEAKQGPLDVVTITRPDEKVVYILLPQQKIFAEKPFLEADGLFGYVSSHKTERELLGTEAVKGQNCDKYKIVIGGRVLYLWVSKSTQTPVQLISADQHTRMEWTNVQVGPQPADLFKPPIDYQKFSSGLGVQPQ